jgi:hypothetical protein
LPASAPPVTQPLLSFPADPIYAAIERHKATGAVLGAAVTVRSRLPDLHMNDEQQRQLKRLEEAIDDAWELCEQAGIDLINTEPTTLAGIVAVYSIYSNPDAQRRRFHAAWKPLRM